MVVVFARKAGGLPNVDVSQQQNFVSSRSAMSSLISAVSWVRRGVAVQHPTKYVLDDKELERVSALERIEVEDAKKELERAHKAALAMGKREEGDEADDAVDEDGNEEDWVDEPSDEDAMDVDSGVKKRDPNDLSEYNLDDYDAEEDDIATAAGPFSNIKGLTYYQNDEDDPYITLKEDDNAAEREELEVLPTDNLLVVAKTEDEISQLEVYVYEESEDNLYVHHDLMLPNFPLCLEWLDFPPTTAGTSSSPAAPFGNYIAVGTLDPEIEIWSLDVLDAMYPTSVLGRPDETQAHVPIPLGTGKKKRKKTKHRSSTTSHHVDAVLALSWNKTHRTLLASGSADRTVKLWDLSRDPSINGEGGGAIRSFDLHTDKVQAVRWNEKDPSVLLTGSYDRTVRTFDTRTPDSGVAAVVGSDVEAMKWDPWEDSGFYVSLENGMVLNFDVRKMSSDLNQPSPARFTLSAHDGAASGLDINPHIRGCIATGGNDKVVKVWNVQDDQKNVSLVTSRDLGVGKVFSVAFSPDDPLTLAAAGSKAKLQIWDVGANMGARKAFGAKLKEAGRVLREREAGDGQGGVVGVASDDEESGDEE
ncbi:WD-REPEATS-REGION domain-containing protein [Mycena indigotica]|uniref:WD-REPEATS-REGION domain-containing protein n=1 Tax=Mycena indigotica TaxID=2126181 RepID=A0A8H6WF71_9AGAR|nr:WD-REPEATS-REGION domain-containing protein [Mycena indigotica]KAF7312588.1 WD-REPEATS-REGION domain-containing protein [Mycena indigotica]